MSRELLQQALTALLHHQEQTRPIHRTEVAIADIRAHLAAQPAPAEPVALESVHLTRDTSGMCTVRVNGRTAIRDNGDIIDHMATLEWFAQPAPVPADTSNEGSRYDRLDAYMRRHCSNPEPYNFAKEAAAPVPTVNPDDIEHPTTRYLLKYLCKHHGIELGEPVADAIRKINAQPAPVPAQCDGGTCGLGGYCAKCPKQTAAPVPVPLTQNQIVDAFCKLPHKVQYVAIFQAGVDFAEQHHGIAASPEQKP